MGDCVSGGRVPLNKLVVLSKPFSSNISVELDLVGPSVVRDNLHGKVGERDRLVHQICWLYFR